MGINGVNQQTYDFYNRMNYGYNNFVLGNSYNNSPIFTGTNKTNIGDSFQKSQTATPKDGKDDGSIGFIGATGNLLKGVGNFFKGMVCDERGKFSLTRTLTTLGIGAAIGVVCTMLPAITIAGTAFSTLGLISAGFLGFAGLHAGKSAIDILSANTDAEAEQAWQNMGSALTEGGLAYLGYRASGGIFAKDIAPATPSGAASKTPKSETVLDEKPFEISKTEPAVETEVSKVEAPKSENVEAVAAEEKLNLTPEKTTEILNNGTKKITEQLRWTTKDGTQLEYTLERSYFTEKTPLGERTQIRYSVKDTDGTVVGTWNGMIQDRNLDGGFLSTKLSTKPTSGLGRELKKLIMEDAKAYDCESIKIGASFHSHVFHRKMGYKCNYSDSNYNIQQALNALKRMKAKKVLPEFDSRVDNVLNTKNAKELDMLLDDILLKAGEKGLKSHDIELHGIEVPMKYSLKETVTEKPAMTMTDEARVQYDKIKAQLENNRPKVNADIIDENLPITPETLAQLDEMGKEYTILERNSRIIGKDPALLSKTEQQHLQKFQEIYNEYFELLNNIKNKKLSLTDKEFKRYQRNIADKWCNYCRENNINPQIFGDWNQNGAQLIKHFFFKIIEDPKRVENISFYIHLLKEQGLNFDLSSTETFSRSSLALLRFITEHATDVSKDNPNLFTGSLKSGIGKVYQITKKDYNGVDTTYSWIGDKQFKDAIIIYGKDPKKNSAPKQQRQTETEPGVLIVSTKDQISSIMLSSFEQYMNRISE